MDGVVVREAAGRPEGERVRLVRPQDRRGERAVVGDDLVVRRVRVRPLHGVAEVDPD